MNGESDNEKTPEAADSDIELVNDESSGDESSDAFADTIVMDTSDMENVGEVTGEINVEKLVKKIESESAEEIERKRKVKQRLEAMKEKADKDLDGTYNISLDDD